MSQQPSIYLFFSTSLSNRSSCSSFHHSSSRALRYSRVSLGEIGAMGATVPGSNVEAGGLFVAGLDGSCVVAKGSF